MYNYDLKGRYSTLKIKIVGSSWETNTRVHISDIYILTQAIIEFRYYT